MNRHYLKNYEEEFCINDSLGDGGIDGYMANNPSASADSSIQSGMPKWVWV